MGMRDSVGFSLRPFPYRLLPFLYTTDMTGDAWLCGLLSESLSATWPDNMTQQYYVQNFKSSNLDMTQ